VSEYTAGMETDEDLRWREVRHDMGESYQHVASASPIKRRVFELLYHPITELLIFALIVASVTLLAIEVAHPEWESAGWMGRVFQGKEHGPFFWADVALTSVFLVEYLLKLWVAPRKRYFIRTNIIDLLAILPLLRIFRIGRAVRLLRLLRLLRLVRIGAVVEERLERVSAERQRYKAENFIIVTYLMFSMVFGTVGILVFEKGHNDGFQTISDGIWWCVVTLTTVGYGDISPVTPGGRMVAGVIMFIGLSFYALLTGTLSSIIIKRSQRDREQDMEIAGMEGHVVVCGWNENGVRLLRDLIHSPGNPHVIVLHADEEIARVLDPRIHYVFRDPTTAEGLSAARIAAARVAVILAAARPEQTSQDIDARTILTVLAVERINPNIHTIVELMSEENSFHARNAGVDEVLVMGTYAGTMLSQAVQSPGVTDVYGDLFNSGTGSQVHEEPAPGDLVGQPFSKAAAALYARGEGSLIGYRRSGEVHLSPAGDPPLRTGDRVIVVRRQAV